MKSTSIITIAAILQSVKYLRIINRNLCELQQQSIQMIKQQQKNENKLEGQQYDTFIYKFQQQIVDAWKPVPHTRNNVILYAILSSVSVSIGLALIMTSSPTQQVYLRYDEACTPSKFNNDNSFHSPCKVTFNLTTSLTAPIYLYYGFKGFYQNHRRYIKYFSRNQLSSGDPWASTKGKTDCSDMYTNLQTFGNNTLALDNKILPNNDPAFPCGTISRMYYQLRDEIQGFKLYNSSGKNIPISQSGIAWPADVGMHVNAPDSQTPFRVTEETWLVWFRPAAESDFYKLNGIISQDMPAGVYTVGIKNQVTPIWGEKWLSVSKSNFQGNHDNFLAVSFLILGGVCLIILLVFLVRLYREHSDENKIQ